jgi:hypothetical protein
MKKPVLPPNGQDLWYTPNTQKHTTCIFFVFWGFVSLYNLYSALLRGARHPSLAASSGPAGRLLGRQDHVSESRRGRRALLRDDRLVHSALPGAGVRDLGLDGVVDRLELLLEVVMVLTRPALICERAQRELGLVDLGHDGSQLVDGVDVGHLGRVQLRARSLVLVDALLDLELAVRIHEELHGLLLLLVLFLEELSHMLQLLLLLLILRLDPLQALDSLVKVTCARLHLGGQQLPGLGVHVDVIVLHSGRRVCPRRDCVLHHCGGLNRAPHRDLHEGGSGRDQVQDPTASRDVDVHGDSGNERHLAGLLACACWLTGVHDG